MTVVLARPFESVTELVAESDPLLLLQLIVRPGKGVPPSLSSTTIGEEAWPVARVCPSPEKIVSVVATSEPLIVAVKVALGPFTTDASTVTVPGVSPSVSVVVAWPLISVTVEVVDSEPVPDVMAKVIGTPLRSVAPAGGSMVTTKGARTWPGFAAWPSPLVFCSASAVLAVALKSTSCEPP